MTVTTCRQCGKPTPPNSMHTCSPQQNRTPCDWCDGEGSRERPEDGAPLVCGRCEGTGLDPEPTP